MPTASFHFPTGFLWGAATAAHQVEGNNTNNTWSLWEAQPGRIKNGDRSGLACDWWGGRWKEDLDRAAETEQNAHRLSIEWSRIQPAPDRWDEDALDRYRSMIRGCVDRGLTPLVTLHHFADPIWVAERGAWENDDTPALFARYVHKAVEALKDYTNIWITINEPNLYASLSYVEGSFWPGKKDLRAAFHATRNLVLGHAAAYREIHAVQKEARVGIALNYRFFEPYTAWSPLDRFLASTANQSINEAFPQAIRTGKLNYALQRAAVPEAKGTQDYLGVNYYSGDLMRFVLKPSQTFMDRSVPQGAELSATGFIANVPTGMFKALKWALQFNVPIIVTENGVEDPDDQLRPQYIIEHIHQVWRAVNFNWPIKGYIHWSLVDNFEWERGWTQRFGLWGLDTATQARIRRPSVDLYAEICRENGITSDMVKKYAPQIYSRLFPG